MASFRFFRERIEEEEEYLVGMYGRQYVDYQARVPSGIPFITGSVHALSLTRFREFTFDPSPTHRFRARVATCAGCGSDVFMRASAKPPASTYCSMQCLRAALQA